MTKTNVTPDPKAIMAIYFNNEVLKKQFSSKVSKLPFDGQEKPQLERLFPWLTDAIICEFGKVEEYLNIQSIQLVHSISKM